MENKYGLFGKLTASPGKGPELVSILRHAASLLDKYHPGCHLYSIGRDPEVPDIIHVYEIWESKAAHDQSLQDPRVRSLITDAMPILDGMPEKGSESEIIGGFLHNLDKHDN